MLPPRGEPRSLVRTGSQVSFTTAVDALRNEEVERTRLFMRLGWVISAAAIATVPFVHGGRAMSIAFIAAMVLGIVVSFGFHQAFRDPTRYSERGLVILSVMSVVNANVAVMYYGVFTATPAIIVIGIHFVARTEAERAARWIFLSAIVCYTVAAAIVIASGSDPGVFASDRPLGLASQLIGTAFVLASYALAYVTARAFRAASLASIDGLQRATRLASQREALMDELRVDLERALRVGGPGRHTGQRVGPFELGIVLGRGAMGEVYEATSTITGEVAAVKLLRRELLTDPTHVARFLREVKASGALASPNVVKILDASADDAAVPWLAMELLHGTTLAEVLRTVPTLSPPDVLELVRQVGAGIDAAAAAGIVHRDLKPQNLFRAGELWKILDFGVATLAEDGGTLTQGGIVGTPTYMAPEQAQGKRVDHRADIYALGAVAYRCLTGRHPFNAPDTPGLLYAVVHRMPMRPSEANEAVTEEIDRWLALALAKSPDDRYATGAALAAALDAALTTGLDPKARKRADALIRRSPWE